MHTTYEVKPTPVSKSDLNLVCSPHFSVVTPKLFHRHIPRGAEGNVCAIAHDFTKDTYAREHHIS